jgi:phosphoenolpyruvate carboxylase
MTASSTPLPDKTRLRQQVRLLGDLLGDIIIASEGQDFLETVQKIRNLSKSARTSGDFEALKDIIDNLSDDEALAIARAFSHFLNLANIADQHDSVISHRRNPVGTIDSISSLCQQVPSDLFQEAIANLHIDLVLTAHPTEITRRTMIHKYQEIDACLSQLEQQDIEPQQHRRVTERLKELLAQTWHTMEFRVNRPTPVDEAKWGYAVVENSLWQAVPAFLRALEDTLTDASLPPVPVHWTPVRFSSWMGGDRDGNPTVTSGVTRQVLLLSRWQACDLFAQDLNRLIEELSMSDCAPALRDHVGDSHEPYRAVLRPLRNHLVDDRDALTRVINSGGTPPPPPYPTRSSWHSPWTTVRHAATGTLLWSPFGAPRHSPG